MKFAVFLFLCLIANVFSKHFCLHSGDVAVMHQVFPEGLNTRVVVDVDFGGDFDVRLCAQQGIITKNVLSCTPDGKLNVTHPSQFQSDAIEIPEFEDIYKMDYNTYVGESVSSSSSRASFYLRDGVYYISIGVYRYSSNDSTCASFNLSLSYSSCDQGKVGPMCEAPLGANANASFTAKIGSGPYTQKMFYNVDLASNVLKKGVDVIARYPVDFKITVDNVVPAGNLANQIKVSLRRGSFPAFNVTDGVAEVINGTKLFYHQPYPIPDNYIVYVEAADGVIAYDIKFATPTCPDASYINAQGECSSNFTVFTNDEVVNATEIKADDEVHYFRFEQQHGIMFGVGTAKLKNNAPSVSASPNFIPSPDNGLIIASGDKVNFISAHLPAFEMSETLVDWYVVVNATDDLFYWGNQACPNNCSKDTADSSNPEGVCNTENGTCTCNSGYKGLFCEKDRTIFWIILIVIILAIIIACCIGVPFAIYFKNKRRKSYETV